MTSQMTRLIVVAYPMDETLVFSEVCRGADIVAVGSMYQNVCHDKLAGDFREAGAVLGARSTSYLGLPEQESFPAEALENALTSCGPYERVYTHSPLDEDSFRVWVALTVSKVFGTVWIPAIGAPPMEVHALTRDLFLRKVEIMNRYYSEHIHPRNKECSLSHAALSEVESFVEAGYDEVMRAAALNTGDILDHPDPWGFKTSLYERIRFTTTCQLLVDHAEPGSITDILEVGACEGEMTALLRAAFPDAAIRAVESQPRYAENLQARFRDDPHVTVVQSSAMDVPLEAGVIVLAEMLYYLEDDMQEFLKRLQAKYLLISCDGDFDLELHQELTALGWRQIAYQRVSPKFEPVDGKNSNMVSLRAGTNVRLWGRQAAPVC
jgi:hypothetical protein